MLHTITFRARASFQKTLSSLPLHSPFPCHIYIAESLLDHVFQGLTVRPSARENFRQTVSFVVVQLVEAPTGRPFVRARRKNFVAVLPVRRE